MNINKNNIYLRHINSVLPRILSLFDNDKTSNSYGVGDRYYWAWGLIDFGNATFQGASNGMALLMKNNLWPYNTKKNIFIDRIDSMFRGCKFLTRNNGSLEEAFPNEGSYCVTSLVAYNLLVTYNLLYDDIDLKMKQEWFSTIEPLIKFIIKNEENHAIITNHDATCLAALVRWEKLTKDKFFAKKSKLLFEKIMNNFSSEGWFYEYGGADPGYQSLCLCYLADIDFIRPDWDLKNKILKATEFISYFAHPDGSFAGNYGSRSTQILYPAGIEYFSLNSNVFGLDKFIRKSLENKTTVSLEAIDEPNLIPLFNSYCWAASLYAKNTFQKNSKNLEKVPCYKNHKFRKYFNDAGLLIDKGSRHYTIISTWKGGVIRHFVDNKLKIKNDGVVITDKNKNLGSSQSYNKDNKIIWLNENKFLVESKIMKFQKKNTSPKDFLLLRIICLFLFKLKFVRDIIKKLIVRILITNKKIWPTSNTRTITLGEKLDFKDKLSNSRNFKNINFKTSFVSIHMASKGYWQIQDEELK